MRIVENSREKAVKKEITRLCLKPSVCAAEVDCFEKVAEKTPGFLYGDLKLLLDNSIKAMKIRREPMLNMELLDKTLNDMQTNFADSLGAPKVPKVLWSEIGGLAKIKQEIQNSIGLPLKYGHLMGKNMRRSGILLYGPPGKINDQKIVWIPINVFFFALLHQALEKR
jgi:SpoVK/Ycf46/Vps4 family AAA+-type ATPase